MTNIPAQGSKILIWDGIAPTNNVGVSTTKAKPAVMTLVSATGLAVGSVIVPKGTGFKSIDEVPFRISVLAGMVATLEDSDTSGETGVATAGSVDKYTLIEMCLATFNVTQPAGSTLDVTTLCDVSRKTLVGLAGVGSWTGNGFWDGPDAGQLAARGAYRSRAQQVFRVNFPDGSGLLFRGALNQLDIGLAVDAPVTIALGGPVSGFINRTTVP